MDRPAEHWVPVPGFETKYEVSNEGRVRNSRGRILATQPGGRRNNYLRVMLQIWKGKVKAKQRFAYIHHVVLEAFVGPRPNGAVVCHRNDDGHDNRLANLYYGSQEDNEQDKYINKLDMSGMEPAPF